MNNTNKVLYFPDECPLLLDMSLFDTTDLFPNNNKLLLLPRKSNINTQGLKVELERLKRKRLGMTLKRVHQETTPSIVFLLNSNTIVT